MTVDLVPLERRLHDLFQSLRSSEDDEASWLSVKTTAEEIANTLRVRNTEGIFFHALRQFIHPSCRSGSSYRLGED